DLDDLGITGLLGPLDVHQQSVDTTLARELPLRLVGDPLLGDPLPGGQVLLVLVGQLYVGDVAAGDGHSVPLQLTVEQPTHVLDVGSAQVVGGFGVHLAAALANGVLHRAGQHQVEVAGTDDVDEPDRVDDAELQEELDRLQRHVLPGRAGQDRRGVGDLRTGVHHEVDPCPRVPQVVAPGADGTYHGSVLGEDPVRALLDLDDRSAPPPQSGRDDREYSHEHRGDRKDEIDSRPVAQSSVDRHHQRRAQGEQAEPDQDRPAQTAIVARDDHGHDRALITTAQQSHQVAPGGEGLLDAGATTCVHGPAHLLTSLVRVELLP